MTVGLRPGDVSTSFFGEAGFSTVRMQECERHCPDKGLTTPTQLPEPADQFHGHSELPLLKPLSSEARDRVTDVSHEIQNDRLEHHGSVGTFDPGECDERFRLIREILSVGTAEPRSHECLGRGREWGSASEEVNKIKTSRTAGWIAGAEENRPQ